MHEKIITIHNSRDSFVWKELKTRPKYTPVEYSDFINCGLLIAVLR